MHQISVFKGKEGRGCLGHSGAFHPAGMAGATGARRQSSAAHSVEGLGLLS